jgi:DNA-binding winged helix-turn-helix (wHTH) protein
MHFLRRHDVQQHYWRTDQSWIIPIDAHSLIFGDQSAETVTLEFMLHRLIMEAERHDFAADVIGWANDLHARLMAQPSPRLGMRYLERFCARLCEQHAIQLVFLFDQFENLWHEAQPYFFRNLRYLRDQFKYRVVYVAFSRQPLSASHAAGESVEAFWELFSSHVYPLGMHTPTDAALVLERLVQRTGVELEPRTRQQILHLCGGHPGLIRAVFWTVLKNPQTTIDAHTLLEVPAVVEECCKIWSTLYTHEQHTLRAVAAGEAPAQLDQDTLALLQLQGLLAGQEPRLFAPLFEEYISEQTDPAMQGIVVNVRLRQVWVDGQNLDKNLSRLEFSLLEHLARHVGVVCRREEILQTLYGKEPYDVNDERLDTILRRLRESLNEDARNPRYLVTHRGVGLQLLSGAVQE